MDGTTSKRRKLECSDCSGIPVLMTAVSDVDQLLATISAEDLCTFDVGGLMNVAELDSALWRSNGFVKPGSTPFGAVVAKLLAEGAAMREVGNNEGWYNRLVVLTNTVVDTIFRRVQPGTVVEIPHWLQRLSDEWTLIAIDNFSAVSSGAIADLIKYACHHPTNATHNALTLPRGGGTEQHLYFEAARHVHDDGLDALLRAGRAVVEYKQQCRPSSSSSPPSPLDVKYQESPLIVAARLDAMSPGVDFDTLASFAAHHMLDQATPLECIRLADSTRRHVHIALMFGAAAVIKQTQILHAEPSYRLHEQRLTEALECLVRVAESVSIIAKTARTATVPPLLCLAAGPFFDIRHLIMNQAERSAMMLWPVDMMQHVVFATIAHCVAHAWLESAATFPGRIFGELECIDVRCAYDALYVIISDEDTDPDVGEFRAIVRKAIELLPKVGTNRRISLVRAVAPHVTCDEELAPLILPLMVDNPHPYDRKLCTIELQVYDEAYGLANTSETRHTILQQLIKRTHMGGARVLVDLLERFILQGPALLVNCFMGVVTALIGHKRYLIASKLLADRNYREDQELVDLPCFEALVQSALDCRGDDTRDLRRAVVEFAASLVPTGANRARFVAYKKAAHDLDQESAWRMAVAPIIRQDIMGGLRATNTSITDRHGILIELGLIGSICNTGTDPPVCLVDWTFGSKKNLYWVDLVVARCRASAELADALMGQRPDLAMSVLVDVCMGAISTRTQIVEAAVAVRTMSVLYARPDAWDYVLDLLHKTPSLATIRSALLTQIDTQVNVILRIVAPDQAKAEQMRRILQQVDECRRRVDRTPGRMCPLCDYQQLPTLVDGVSVVCPDCCNEIVLLVD